MAPHRVSESTAYRVIQKLNDELEVRGFLTFKARVISRYFYKRYVIFTNATAWRANRESMRVDKICERCGQVMHRVAPHRRYCQACRMAKKRERAAREYEAHKNDPAYRERKRRKKKPPSAEEDLFTPEELAAKTVAARKMGMSYGHYSAWLRLQGENNDEKTEV